MTVELPNLPDVTPTDLALATVGELLDKVICPYAQVQPQRWFLCWLLNQQHRELTPEQRAAVQGMLSFSFNYANADCDWRQWVRDFVLDEVPAKLWLYYGRELAQLLKERVAR